MSINLWEKHQLEMEMKRARWSMEIQAGRSAKYSILPQLKYDIYGNEFKVWNIYAVDNTRGARDRNYGMPVLLNRQCPFSSFEEAQEYAKRVFVDRKAIYFRGFQAPLISGRNFKLSPPVERKKPTNK